MAFAAEAFVRSIQKNLDKNCTGRTIIEQTYVLCSDFLKSKIFLQNLLLKTV